MTNYQGMICEGACAHAHVRCAVARVHPYTMPSPNSHSNNSKKISYQIITKILSNNDQNLKLIIAGTWEFRNKCELCFITKVRNFHLQSIYQNRFSFSSTSCVLFRIQTEVLKDLGQLLKRFHNTSWIVLYHTFCCSCLFLHNHGKQ